MSLPEHSIITSNSNLEEYSYHLEQASQFLQYAEQAQHCMEHAMEHFHRHNAWLKEHATKSFIA